MANRFLQFLGGGGTGVPGITFTKPTDVDALPLEIKNAAFNLGIKPLDLAKAISYETSGTFDKAKRGPVTKWGQHEGLIQWGQPQQKQYGVDVNGPSDEQMVAVQDYLKDAGVQPGMGELDIYSAINAGQVGRYNASDRPGQTVRTHVAAMAGHEPNAEALLGEPKTNRFSQFVSQPAQQAQAAAGSPEVLDVWGRLLQDTNRQLEGVAQGTTPIIEGQEPNLVSDKVFQDELGNANYLDPADGKVKPTDKSKHILMTDRNGKLAVYNRTAKTDEGVLGTLGHLAVQGFQGAPEGVLPRAVSAAKAGRAARAADLADTAESAERLGMETPKWAYGSGPKQFIAQQVGRLPWVGEPIAESSERAVEALGQNKGATAGRYSFATPEGAGSSVRKGVEDWITRGSKALADTAYDKVDDLIDPTFEAPLRNTARVAEEINSDRLNAGLKPSPAVAQVMEAATRPGMNYKGIKTLRGEIGRQTEQGLLPPELSKRELERIYGALTKDMEQIIRASGGPAAEAAWNRANRLYGHISQRREDLARMLGATSSEGLAAKLHALAGSNSRADVKTLLQARKTAGAQAWRDLAGSIVNKMGMTKDGDFSPARFASEYGALSHRGRSILFRSTQDGNLAQILDDIFIVSKHHKGVERLANSSRTAAGVSLIGAAYSVAAAVSSLTLAPVVAALTPIIGGRIVAKLLSRPTTAKAVRDWARSFQVVKQSRTRRALTLYAQAAKVLSLAIAKEEGDPQRAQAVYRKLGKDL